MKNKTLLISVLALSITFSGCSLFKKKKTEETTGEKRSLITEPVNIIDVAQRPYITITPRNDGRELTLAIGAVNKEANEAEFELEYSTGDLIQGAFGSIDVSSGSGDYPVLLGSCSAGGACSYHENVSGGEATVSMRGGAEKYAVKLAWRYQKTSEAKGAFGTTDQKFQLSGDGLFKASNYVVVAETSGPAAEVDGTIAAGPYGVFPSDGIEGEEATVMIRGAEDLSGATLYGWNGTEWVELTGEVDGKSVSFDGTVYESYVVVK